ncbi:MAG TPA: serine hydrolase domain-containing protein [Bacteroidales bacterium]|nr:serine hydrolase domain-containing protein [Bacteroidales bacterium]
MKIILTSITRIYQIAVIIAIPIYSILSAGCTKDSFLEAGTNTFQIPDNTHPESQTFQSLIDKYVQKGVPGISLYINSPVDGFFMGTSGFACIETGEIMSKTSIHYSASISKVFIAILILKLQEEGKLNIEEGIDNYLSSEICSNIKYSEDIRVRDLLNHTSGIYDYTYSAALNLAFLDKGFKGFSTHDFLEAMYKGEPFFKSGEDFFYSNSNYMLLALIIDNITGNHANYLQETIIVPLDLTTTFYKQDPRYPGVEGLVNTYMEKGENKIINVSYWQQNLIIPTIGDAGLLFSLTDCASFFNTLFTGNMLNPSSMEILLDGVQDPTDENTQYGAGVWIYKEKYGGTWWGHGGSDLGSTIAAAFFPESGTIIIITANIGTYYYSELGELVRNDLWNEILEVEFK